MERMGAGVAEEIVAGEDVVHLQAVPAHEALANVALEQRVVADELLPFSVSEALIARQSPAGLAGVGGAHDSSRDAGISIELTIRDPSPDGPVRRSIMQCLPPSTRKS
jgi:hypothetical protein